jgi:hypothetical protein
VGHVLIPEPGGHNAAHQRCQAELLEIEHGDIGELGGKIAQVGELRGSFDASAQPRIPATMTRLFALPITTTCGNWTARSSVPH